MADGYKVSNKLPAAVLVAVLPADDDDKTPPPPVSNRILLTVTVCMWALVHALAFAIAILIGVIANGTPCNKNFVVDVAAPPVRGADRRGGHVAERPAARGGVVHHRGRGAGDGAVQAFNGQELFIRGRWAAAVVDALAWVALAATAGIHWMHIASDRVYLAADPGERYFFVDVVLVSGCLTVDVVLAGFLLCCRR